MNTAKFTNLALLFSMTSLLVSPACFALRCGTDLIEKGDLKIQVEEKCGKPISKEVIGYTLQRLPARAGFIHEREFLVEEWIYRFQRRYYDVLTFEAGRLKRLEKIRR